jgi:hypothetical protein
MKNQYSITQEKIAELIEKVKEEVATKEESRKWKKYYGDVCVRIFREFILKEIPPRYTLSSPNAYIVGFPTEFDVLVVNKDTKPIKYTNMHRPEKVEFGIEIKAHGVFGGQEDLEKYIRNIKDNFDAVKSRYPHIDFIYLTYEEVAFPKRKTSIRYLDETVRILEPYKVFCLKDSRTRKLIDGEWEKLASSLNNYLQRGGS